MGTLEQITPRRFAILAVLALVVGGIGGLAPRQSDVIGDTAVLILTQLIISACVITGLANII